MPSGHPKDPVATAAKMAASRKARAAKKIQAKKSNEVLHAIQETITSRDTNKNEVPVVTYGRELEFEIDSLQGQLRTQQGINDELRDRLMLAERRLFTVLDLVSSTLPIR